MAPKGCNQVAFVDPEYVGCQVNRDRIRLGGHGRYEGIQHVRVLSLETQVAAKFPVAFDQENLGAGCSGRGS